MSSLSLEYRSPVESHQREAHEDLRQALAAFLRARPRLWGIAYRTLGSVSDAEDVLQEAWMRWQRTDRTRVINPTAFLAVTTSRLALNAATAGHTRHETSVDPQSLEAVRPEDDPESRATKMDEVERAMRHLLATLTPAELAAYLLRKSFDYPYARIAATLGIRQDSARQLVSRAQRGIGTRAPRPVEPDTVRRHITALRIASDAGRVDVLEHELRTRVEKGARCITTCGAVA